MDPNKITCDKCKKSFLRKNVARHRKACSGSQQPTIEPQRPCVHCGTLVTLSNMSRHQKNCSKKRASDEPTLTPHRQRIEYDAVPTTRSSQPSTMNNLRSSIISAYNKVASALPNNLSPTLEIKEVEKAFKGRMKTYAIENTPGIKDPKQFHETARPLVIAKIKEQVEGKKLKNKLSFARRVQKPVNNEEITQEMNFKTKNIVVHPTDTIEEYVKEKEKKKRLQRKWRSLKPKGQAGR